MSVPASSTVSLALQTGAALTFAGKTTFGTTLDSDFDPIVLTGTDITVTGAAGHVIDANGQNYCPSKQSPSPSVFFQRWTFANHTVVKQGTEKAQTADKKSRTTSSW